MTIYIYDHQCNINNIQIISMENNSIRAKGTYRVIESKDYELIEEWKSIIAKENAKDEIVWYVIAVHFSQWFFFVVAWNVKFVILADMFVHILRLIVIEWSLSEFWIN